MAGERSFGPANLPWRLGQALEFEHPGGGWPILRRAIRAPCLALLHDVHAVGRQQESNLRTLVRRGGQGCVTLKLKGGPAQSSFEGWATRPHHFT
jgi:hypothetical protein